jgi:hypothetical protein
MQYGKMTLATVALCGWALCGGSAQALADTDAASNGESESVMALPKRFVSAEGYKKQNISAVNSVLEQRLTPINPNSIFMPSKNLSAFVKAVLVLEANEVELERVRYRLRYGQRSLLPQPEAYLVPVSFVQIDRFNIGPGIREELVVELGAERVAPAAVFGDGPHVSWRLAMRPVQGQRADIVAVSRADIPNAVAQAEDCLGAACLDTGLVLPDAAPWGDVPVPSRKHGSSEVQNQDVTYATERNGLLTPAAAIDMLTEDFSYEPREGAETSAPFAEAVIEMNLAQDASLGAALREGKLMDDSISAAWHSVWAMPSGLGFEAQFSAGRAFECRRGSAFAEPGEYCP